MDMTFDSDHEKTGMSDDAKFIAELGVFALASLLISVLVS